MSHPGSIVSSVSEPVSRLVGRTYELETLHTLLLRQGARLITLSGPGGIGKTRLALAAAAGLQSAYAHGAQFVDLSPLADPRQVMTALASALGVSDTAAEPLAETLESVLRERRQLLVLDNFERVLAAAPEIVRLLEACPGLAVLVTSRARLHVDGEQVLPISPLPESEAVQLFVERAGAARADFHLTDTNASAVADICLRLDGIPLAIELAAARVKVLSAEQIAERLQDRFKLLTAGAADAPARHRTLRAAVDWSFDLLPEPERALLRRMAVFAAGASIDALEAVCPDAASVLDCLAQLVDQSLVNVSEQAGVARYRLLDTVRQYALERLREAGEEPAVRARHAAWCVRFVEHTEPDVLGRDQLASLASFELDHANLRAALTWSLETHSAETALRLAGGLWKFWEVHGHAGEGERWLSAALELDSDGSADPRARSKALHGAANLAFVRADYDRTAALHEANLALRRQLDDQLGIGISLFHLASVQRSRGETERAVELFRESLALFRAFGDRQWCANVLNGLGLTLSDRRALSAARSALEEALALYRALGGTRRVAIALLNLGDLARAEGDHQRADAQLRQSLELFHQLQDAWCSSIALENLALLAATRGYAERSAQLFGAAEAQREEAGAVLPPVDRPEYGRAVASIALRLGSELCSGAWARGRSLSREAALALAQQLDLGSGQRGESARPALVATSDSVSSPLTEREREVASLVASGLTNKQIADALVITKQTADKHVGNILGSSAWPRARRWRCGGCSTPRQSPLPRPPDQRLQSTCDITSSTRERCPMRTRKHLAFVFSAAALAVATIVPAYAADSWSARQRHPVRRRRQRPSVWRPRQ
jgi:predicted ATPase/DNA-binding CsgD family transcriptional regulator